MKILLNALSGIGDALMFTPALKILKSKIPDSSIDALVMYKGVEEIYNSLPQITSVHYHDFLNSPKLKSLKKIISLRKKYDVSINIYPSNRKEYNLINFLLGAKQKLAVKYLRQDFQNLGFLNNQRITEDDSFHNVRENVNLINTILSEKVTELPKLEFPVSEEAINRSDIFLSENEIDNSRLLIGIHPGCSTLKNHTNRRWAPEKFADLSQKLLEKYNCSIVLFGGPEEKELRQTIIERVQSENIISADVDSLETTAAIMKNCKVFITNDSSLMHVAAALSLNVVCIIGPTNLKYIHPWRTEYKTATLNLDCSPCFYYSPKPLDCSRSSYEFECIKELQPNNVLQLVEKFLS